MAPPSSQPLLSVRTTVVLMAGLVLGVVIGALTVISGQHVALAVAVGLGAEGSSVATLHKLVGT